MNRKFSAKSLLFHLYVKLVALTVLRSPVRMIKASCLFDETGYLNSPPIMDITGIDPVVHYLLFGRFFGKSPGEDFFRAFYINDGSTDNRKQFDIFRWIFHRKTQFRVLSPKEIITSVRAGLKSSSSSSETPASNISAAYQPPEASPLFEAEYLRKIPDTSLKLLAYYLPQFHPFEENDRFWGKGFTEWTNVTKAQPLFKEHLQPRLPGELGFYDTRIKYVMKRQMELAKQHGIHGFCLHHYFFQGKPVMRIPFNQIMENPDLDLPFCLHWANESWSRKFDGYGHAGGMLIEQKHTAEDDLAFYKDIEPALNDKRYIRVDGKPLLMVYRPGLFPDMVATTDRWRECAVKSGIGGLFLVMVQTGFDELLDPGKLGFDAASEFPPHRSKNISIKDQFQLYDSEFNGYICSYPEVMKGSIERMPPDYPLLKGIFPGWDNTPRVRNSVIYHGSTPKLYQEWLETLGKYTTQHFPPSQQFIFINAWNEWAEGAYLEPDRIYGYSYLNATSRALENIARNNH